MQDATMGIAAGMGCTVYEMWRSLAIYRNPKGPAHHPKQISPLIPRINELADVKLKGRRPEKAGAPLYARAED